MKDQLSGSGCVSLKRCYEPSRRRRVFRIRPCTGNAATIGLVGQRCRPFLVLFTLFTLLSLAACTTVQPASIDKLQSTLKKRVWPGFSPLEKPVSIQRQSGRRIVLSTCSAAEGACTDRIDADAMEHAEFVTGGEGDWSVFRDKGTGMTARLVAHEMFHLYQKTAPEFATTGLSEAVPELSGISVSALASYLEYADTLKKKLEGSRADCPQRSINGESSTNPLVSWVLANERIEGSALWVGLEYERLVTSADRGALRRLIARNISARLDEVEKDVMSFSRDLAYLTGAGRVELHGRDSLLEADGPLPTCDHSEENFELAKDLIAQSRELRGELAAEFLGRSRVWVKTFPRDAKIMSGASARIFYSWGQALKGGAGISTPTGGPFEPPIYGSNLLVAECGDEHGVVMSTDESAFRGFSISTAGLDSLQRLAERGCSGVPVTRNENNAVR